MEDRRSKYINPSQAIRNKDLKIVVNFDITELDLMCAYILSENRAVKRSNIINLRNLLGIIDMSVYGNDTERLGRINFILKGIEARLEYNLIKTDMIFNHIYGGLGNGAHNQYKELSNPEVEWVNSTVSETLKYAIIYNDVDEGLALLTKFKATDYIHRGASVKEIENWINNMQVKFRRSKSSVNDDAYFSLDGDNYIEGMLRTYDKVTSPSNRVVFGVQALNILTGGGAEAGRVYTILGLPGEGKSATLIDMAIQIKRYNRNYRCADPTKRPCVVLLTMENSQEESIQRLFSMCVGTDMINYSRDEIMDILKTQGQLVVNDADPISLIIKYRPNLSEDTSYLYTLVEDLEDDGYETICLIQDYIKRIRPADGMFGGDLRQQLGAVINDFKTFATLKNIPVITASQLNRDATSKIDENRIKNKADLVRVLGRSNVGESNLILENSDWIALIAPEYDKAGVKYLGMQRVKSRYYIPNDTYCVYMPYITDTIKFIEDFYSPVPQHKTKMAEQVMINGGINSAQGAVNQVREYTDFNDIKLPTNDMQNMFANANSFAQFNMNGFQPIVSGFIKPMGGVEMCKIVEKKEMCKIVSKEA